jgi:hypothetical protein
MPDLPSTPADGNVKIVWVPAVADMEAPSAAILNGATAVDLSCYLTADGFNPGLDESVISDGRLCETETFEQPGRTSRTLSLTYINNSNTALDNEAYETLVPGVTGVIVRREGKPFDAVFATGDETESWPVKSGKYSKLPPEANSVLRVTQKQFVTGRVTEGVVVA